jgi:hypothetical protein
MWVASFRPFPAAPFLEPLPRRPPRGRPRRAADPDWRETGLGALALGTSSRFTHVEGAWIPSDLASTPSSTVMRTDSIITLARPGQDEHAEISSR